MSLPEKIFNVINTDKWDYAKLAQIASLLGGPKEAFMKIVAGSAVAGAVFVEGGKRIIKKIQSKSKELSNNEKDAINDRTEAYLAKRKKMKASGEDTSNLDKEYNKFMQEILGEVNEDKEELE